MLIRIRIGCHYAECYCVECHYDKWQGAQMSPWQKWNYFLSLIWNLRRRTISSMLQLVCSSAKLLPWLIFTLYRYLRTHTHTHTLALSLSLSGHTHTLSGLTHYLSQDTHTISLKTHILSGHTLSGHTYSQDTHTLRTHHSLSQDTHTLKTDRQTHTFSLFLSLSVTQEICSSHGELICTLNRHDRLTDGLPADRQWWTDGQTPTDAQTGVVCLESLSLSIISTLVNICGRGKGAYPWSGALGLLKILGMGGSDL